MKIQISIQIFQQGNTDERFFWFENTDINVATLVRIRRRCFVKFVRVRDRSRKKTIIVIIVSKFDTELLVQNEWKVEGNDGKRKNCSPEMPGDFQKISASLNFQNDERIHFLSNFS